MVFWQFWEVAFQAFMILIGVGIIWLKFIEPLFPSRQVSVTADDHRGSGSRSS